MKYTSIFEKLDCLLQIISSSIVYSGFLVILAIIILLLIFKKINKKKAIILMLINNIVLFSITIINNIKEISKVFDNIATNFFTNIYFPSTYTYLFILTVINITCIKGILNKESKAYKIANTICFFIIQFIFVLILNIVATNKIDIFVKKSLFSNTNLVILLEMSINIFLIWLLARTIIYTTDKIAESISLNKIIKNENIINNNTLIVNNIKEIEPEIKKEVSPKQDYVLAIDNDIKEIKEEKQDLFSLNDLIFTTQNTTEEIKEETSNEELLDKLINNKLPVIHNEEKNEKRNNYTLNDYRIFNKILKDIRETNNSNIIAINKELEAKLSNKYSEEEYELFKLMLKSYSN